MANKNISVPVAILIALGVAIANYLVRDFNTASPFFNIYMKVAQPYLIGLAFLCFLAPTILLLTYVLSPANSRGVNEPLFHKLLKSFTHLSAIFAVILNLGWIWAFYLIYGTVLGVPLKLLFIVGAIIVFVLISVIDALVQRYCGTRWYNVFHWAV